MWIMWIFNLPSIIGSCGYSWANQLDVILVCVWKWGTYLQNLANVKENMIIEWI